MADEFWVARLSPADAATVWPKALPCLVEAIAGSSGLFVPEDVEARVTAPDTGWHLWIICERDQILGACTTKLQFYPREPVLEVVFAGGSGMDRVYPLALGEIEKFASQIGCKRLRCGGRRGWAKLGWNAIGHLHERVFA